MSVTNFRELVIWKLGKEIVVEIYRLTAEFPREEAFGLTSQLRRAAVSVPSNIAEGFCRHTRNEFRRFLQMSLGSSAELETHIEVAYELGYLQKEQSERILEKIQSESKMLRKMMDVQ